jgi:hypothetical protein
MLEQWEQKKRKAHEYKKSDLATASLLVPSFSNPVQLEKLKK